MRISTIIKKLLNVNKAKVTDIHFGTDQYGEEVLVVRLTPYKRDLSRCGICGCKCPQYDRGTEMRRWRALDLGIWRVMIECFMPRVSCPIHGVVAQQVNWARHGSRFTIDFEDTVAWLAKVATKSVISEYMRINWRTVGGIISRVVSDKSAPPEERFTGLIRIGIDETSYKKGHKYLLVVVNHDTGKLIWIGESKTKEELGKFFNLLTKEQRDSIELVTADAAQYIATTVKEYCEKAELSMDPFHVVQWATTALDDVRKRIVRELNKTKTPKVKSKPGRPKKGEEKAKKKDPADVLKGTKYALLKNPENLTTKQSAKLEMLIISNPQMHRAYLLKEHLRMVFKLPIDEAREELERWRGLAWRSKIPEFVALQRTIKAHKESILKSIELGVSNARLEAINNNIKVTIRMAYGFRNIDNLIALLMLRNSDIDIMLPGRVA